MIFTPLQDQPIFDRPSWIFLFDDTGIATDSNSGGLPCLDPRTAKKYAAGELYPFGSLDGTPCLCGSLYKEQMGQALSRTNLRGFFNGTGDDLREAVSVGRFVADLHGHGRFCGRCGTQTRPVEGEHARTCPNCGLHAYPRISPAVIMAVTRGEQILLARGVNFPDKTMFSVLAGFVAPGETLEDCVKREVFEETRIRVKNVRYVKSQPWPFPDSLMIGFTAEYESGEIEIDPVEIADAGWFTKERIPPTPVPFTLAGQLIRQFLHPDGTS